MIDDVMKAVFIILCVVETTIGAILIYGEVHPEANTKIANIIFYVSMCIASLCGAYVIFYAIYSVMWR